MSPGHHPIFGEIDVGLETEAIWVDVAELAEVREKPKDSGVHGTTPLVIRAICTPKEKLPLGPDLRHGCGVGRGASRVPAAVE